MAKKTPLRQRIDQLLVQPMSLSDLLTQASPLISHTAAWRVREHGCRKSMEDRRKAGLVDRGERDYSLEHRIRVGKGILLRRAVTNGLRSGKIRRLGDGRYVLASAQTE